MNKKAFETKLENKIINKINELYITERKKHLVLNKKGEYSTVAFVPLHDGLLEKHLRGIETVGVFSGKEISKFICFDIDMANKKMLKWVYYLLMESLIEIGLNEKYIHVSSSGYKGLHVLLFVQNGSSLEHFKCLFTNVMKMIQSMVDDSIKTKLYNEHELKLEIKDIANIEFRPTHFQGVKLEMGVNFKNKDNAANKCLFVNKDTLELLNLEYILSIEAMPKDEFLDLMDILHNTYEEQIEEHKSLIKQEIKEPRSHKINKDEDVTIEHIIDLIQNGLHMSGTRHNSILKISKYFRYMGLEIEESIEELKSWMIKQDKKYYTTPLEEALSECERVCRIVYDREYSLVGHVDNLKIYKSEMKEIINIENKNDKILLYTMLIHSKRFATNNKVFYMTYKQIHEMCGIGDDGARESIKRLEEGGHLEIISRNTRQENSYKHKPNKYRININTNDAEDEVVLEIDNTLNTLNNNDLYYRSILKTFTNKELKHLPARQYKELTKYRKLIVV